jgi:hypothetical protein
MARGGLMDNYSATFLNLTHKIAGFGSNPYNIQNAHYTGNLSQIPAGITQFPPQPPTMNQYEVLYRIGGFWAMVLYYPVMFATFIAVIKLIEIAALKGW